MKVPVLMPLVLTLALIACGDKQENTASSPATPLPVAKTLPTACQLVTTADVQAAFGQAVEVMVDESETCIYSGTGNTAAFILLTTTVTPSANAAEASDTFRLMLKMQGGMNELMSETLGAANNSAAGQALAGVGDDSWFKVGDTNPLAMTQAMVHKGTVVLGITATGMDGKDAPKFEGLVRKVVEKL
ncbi:hypothetical protein RCF98_10870 [Thiothrix lacustris]|uniref:DUF3558 domain-containing protein n=1 Tax=Thiothrix lacustris TaxID=525917 RepID=A0ABY9MLP1_9GAMM|nr:hypothetical protein [Thiothrix lacustris]WML89472.1 hypothetical protein RCF98_10870 [Thiothrix lacustris]